MGQGLCISNKLAENSLRATGPGDGWRGKTMSSGGQALGLNRDLSSHGPQATGPWARPLFSEPQPPPL